MKFFVLAIVFAVCAAEQAVYLPRTRPMTLLEYFQTNRDEARIISGQPAKAGQFPWQVALTISLNGGSALCGGSLISPRWVLTAAHCVDGGYAWSAKIGGIHRNVANEPGSVVVSSRTGIKHERYNQYLNNDIALVKLDKDVPLSNTIQTIRLPSRSEANDALANIKVTVSGYGKTSDAGGASNNLNYVQLDTITNAECAQYYGTATIISSTICAKGHPQHSTCNGDSGGPLIRTAADGRPTLIGVVSFVSNAGCASGAPSGYVRTASFLDWINQKTGIPIRN